MAYSEHWRAGWEQEAAQLDTSGGRIAKAVDKPVQEMLAALGQDLDTTDDHGWSALMWACAKGRMESVKVLLAAGANPCAKSALVVSYNDMFFHSGMDACAIATKSGNRTEHVWETGFEESTEERAAARRVARFMFHSLNADQRLLAAYRRLLLAAGLESRMWRDDQVGSPLAWAEIELTTIAACVPPMTFGAVCDRFRAQGFAWHGAPPEQPAGAVDGDSASAESGGRHKVLDQRPHLCQLAVLAGHPPPARAVPCTLKTRN